MTFQATALGMVVTGALAGAAGFAGAWYVQGNRYELRISERERELGQQAFKQLEASYAETLRYQSIADKAEANARVRESHLVQLVGAVRGERDRLRNDLDAARNTLPDASCSSVRQYTATLATVFGECAAEVEGLASKADGHASDALKLLEGGVYRDR